MIFSLADHSFQKIDFEMNDTDIFCYFLSDNTIKVPASFWSHAVASSLKLKKNVLILEEAYSGSPSIDFTKRWVIGDKFLWLAPRSSSVLFEAINSTTGTYSDVKAFLTHSK